MSKYNDIASGKSISKFAPDQIIRKTIEREDIQRIIRRSKKRIKQFILRHEKRSIRKSRSNLDKSNLKK